MNLLKLGKGVCKKYRNTVKGNKNTPHELIQKKLTRNVMLAMKAPELAERPGQQLYLYGNLNILVKNDKIVWIKNSKRNTKGFEWDKEKYNELNQILSIGEVMA